MGSTEDGGLHIHDWDDHQSYRKDRGQPPWIKIYRKLLRHPKWVCLTDAQQGQLVNLWLLAADDNGRIPEDPAFLKKICCLDSEPEVDLFISLGFIDDRRQHDADVTPERRQADAPEVEAETETEERLLSQSGEPVVENSIDDGLKWNAQLAGPARKLGGEHNVGRWLAWCRDKATSLEFGFRVLEGLRAYIDAGELKGWLEPGELVGPGVVERADERGIPLVNRAEAYYWRSTEPAPPKSNGMQRLKAQVSV